MLSQENRNFFRFLLLIVQCGTQILIHLLKEALKKKNKTIDQLLQKKENEEKIRRSAFITSPEKELLYPQSPKVRDMSKWDISLLSTVINTFLKKKLKAIEINACEKIKEYRNEAAHNPNLEIDKDTFEREWNSLTNIIRSISSGMKPVKRQQIDENIETIETTDDLLSELKHLSNYINIQDLQKKISRLEMSFQEQAQQTATIESDQKEMKKRLSKVEDTTDELFKIIKDLKEQLDRLSMKPMPVKVKASLNANADEPNAKANANGCLNQVAKDIFEGKITPENLKMVAAPMEDLLNDVAKCGGEITALEEGSVLIEISCPDMEVLLKVMDYFCGPLLKHRLHDVSESLEVLLGQRIQVEAFILRKSVVEFVNKIRRELELMHNRQLKFVISCTGVEGLKKVWNIFENGEAANSINELSVALSDAVGKPVRVEPSIDIEYLKTALQDAKMELEVIVNIDDDYRSFGVSRSCDAKNVVIHTDQASSMCRDAEEANMLQPKSKNGPLKTKARKKPYTRLLKSNQILNKSSE